MPEQEQEKRGVGRPAQYEENRKPVTTWWPLSILKHIDATHGRGQRTKWLIEAAREKMKREQEQQ